jgi:predicted MFS family arabinose efflux permease
LPIANPLPDLHALAAIGNRQSAILMTRRQFKTCYFALTALNTIATCYFSTYVFFYLRDRFGFDDRLNLWVSALYGFIYIFSAWQCGKFAQRRGFLTSLKFGFGGLTIVMVAGALLPSVPAMLCVVSGYGVVLLFTWPALEALVSENETPEGVQHMVGVYNTTWAAAAAFAYFTGGKLYDWSRLGAVFWLPAAIFLGELLFVLYLAREAAKLPAPEPQPAPTEPHHPEAAAFRQSVGPKTFLKMAWLANPFAYVAINTLIAVLPGLTHKLDLSYTQAGLFASAWSFGRLIAFVGLWKWKGWHYRFRWLLVAFVVLIAGFVVILLSPNLWIAVTAQFFFGLAVGLIYYSSLFYSMDVGETKGEHGGLHEAAIGAGICAGPAVGAASLQFLQSHSNAGVFAVSGLLLCGLAGLIGLRLKR